MKVFATTYASNRYPSSSRHAAYLGQFSSKTECVKVLEQNGFKFNKKLNRLEETDNSGKVLPGAASVTILPVDCEEIRDRFYDYSATITR